MKTTNIRKFITSRFVPSTLALVVLSFTVSLFLFSVTKVSAQPLDPNLCYVRTDGEFINTDCPSTISIPEGLCALIAPQRGGGVVAYQLDCQSGNQLGEMQSEEITESAGSLSGVGDPSRAIETDCKVAQGQELKAENCEIVEYLVISINFMSILAAMAIVGSIVVAGYQYMTAKDNSGQVEAARKRILWAMIALGIFIFMYSILNWLVPGGVYEL